MTTPSAILVLTLLTATAGQVEEKDDEQQIEEALLALPENLRDGAAVVKFERGKRIALREGTGGMTCRADDPAVPGIAVWCYLKSHDAYARRWYQLAAEGNEPAQVDAIITNEIKSGKLEWPDVAVNYNLRGRSLDNALLNTVVFVPFATSASLGIPEERDFTRPWLMSSGTAFAHIMIPGQ
jgi:hypothetical protein